MYPLVIAFFGIFIVGSYGLVIGPKYAQLSMQLTANTNVSNLLQTQRAAALYAAYNTAFVLGNIPTAGLTNFYSIGFQGSPNTIAYISGGVVFVYNTSAASPLDIATLATQSGCSNSAGVNSINQTLTTACSSLVSGITAVPSQVPVGALIIVGSL